MRIEQIKEKKKDFIDLLLLADEQESMIDKYIDIGDMFALYDDDLKSICIVTNEGDNIFEIKNLATDPKYQKMGYASKLIKYIFEFYKDKAKTILVGTGDCPSMMKFYGKNGFTYSHRIKNFFIDNCDHLMYEDGILLTDMVYLKKDL